MAPTTITLSFPDAPLNAGAVWRWAAPLGAGWMSSRIDTVRLPERSHDGILGPFCGGLAARPLRRGLRCRYGCQRLGAAAGASSAARRAGGYTQVITDEPGN